MTALNQFSYPLISLGMILVVGLVMWRFFRVRWTVTAAVLAVVVVIFLAGFLILRPGAGNVDSADEAIATVGNGRPTLMAFFSNYCTGCLAVERTVDDLEAEIRADFNVLRINIHTRVGRTLREVYGFSFTPEFVLFDPGGNEVWRGHSPPSQPELDRARDSEST